MGHRIELQSVSAGWCSVYRLVRSAHRTRSSGWLGRGGDVKEQVDHCVDRQDGGAAVEEKAWW